MEGQGYAIIAYTSSVACHREAGRARIHDARPPAVEVTELNAVDDFYMPARSDDDEWTIGESSSVASDARERSPSVHSGDDVFWSKESRA